MSDQLTVFLCDKSALLPTRATPESAGVDLKAPNEVTVPINKLTYIELGIIVQLPKGCYGRVAPRSGLSLKHGIDVFAGVIDRDYQGQLGVLLFNHGSKEHTFKRGEAIAQLICEKCEIPTIVLGTSIQDMKPTERGTKGFGSSDSTCTHD